MKDETDSSLHFILHSSALSFSISLEILNKYSLTVIHQLYIVIGILENRLF
ncbi:hypothetical protein [Amazonocrinis nigriterrae]|uniref:hypothetical protein n=1 Tax=Amazonocrinis nigriterrae TaxID=2840443 RepID=UPI001BE3EA24|nr:hypothetical protein [Amazonocrinis nigriterrae]